MSAGLPTARPPIAKPPTAMQPAVRWMRVWMVWLLIAATETVHGLLRRALLLPRVGETDAHRTGVAVGAVLILLIALACVRWMGLLPGAETTPEAQAASVKAQWRVGAAWVLAMLAFEFGLGAALGTPMAHLLDAYDPRRGGWMAAGMAVLAAAPWLAARLRCGAHRGGVSRG